jgi:cytosine/adenosine deaminase-related metal-dependent hydrolase
MPTTLIHNATILTMNDRLDILEGSVLVRDGTIVSVGPEVRGPADTIVDARGGYLLPGFIQTHVHLCQTLFRGSADDMPLLEWLRRRVWPMEAAHTPSTLRASVQLAAAELLLSGTTTVLTMETVHDTDVVFEALAEIGLRATVGKCMMDASGDAPSRLQEPTKRSIDESVALKKRWHGAADGRLRHARTPSSTRTRPSHATRSRWSVACPAGARTWSTSRPPVWRRRSSASRTVSGSPSPSRACWPSAGSRCCTVPART